VRAGAILPRKNCALEFRNFVVWLRIIIIIAARPEFRADGIRALWAKIGNSFQPPPDHDVAPRPALCHLSRRLFAAFR
jgi:hypothetical protein